MRVMRAQVTKLAFGIPALAGLCLLQGCGMFGSKEDPQSGTEVVQPVPLSVEEPPMPLPELPVILLTTPYTVAKGDTLSTIARRYGLRWQDVAAANPDINPNKLRIGQVVQLPGDVKVPKQPAVRSAATAAKTSIPVVAVADGKSVTYKIQKNDTLSGIAYRYGVTVAALKADNNLKSDVIYAGKTLKIVNPTKTPPAQAVEKRAAATVKAPAPKAPSIKVPEKTTPAQPQPAQAAQSKAPQPPKPVVAEKSVATPPAPVAELPEKAANAAPVIGMPPPVEPVIPPPPTVAVTEQPKEPKTSYRNYTVKDDEDLFAVAIRWGVSPNEIKAVNGLSSYDLTPGVTLKIPIPEDKQ